MISRARLAQVGAVASFVLLSCATTLSQNSVSLPTGQVVAKVLCLSDTSQSYALYLPSKYAPQQKWPILYAFDPRAHGLVAVETFKEAAEKYGYIVAGSNNSRNGPWEMNLAAIRAVWEDTHRRFALDEKRVYTTGFSGGARVATAVALGLRGQVAGVIACGAGFPIGPGLEPARDTPFVYFATIGIRDFNFDELKALDEKLDGLGVVHRVEVFSGGHGWAPKDLAMQALEWMEVQAMKSGRKEMDAGLIDDLFRKRLEEARASEQSGDLAQAFKRYRALAMDFQGLKDVPNGEAQAEQLTNSKEVQRALRREAKREGRISDSVRMYMNGFYRTMETLKGSAGDPQQIHQAIQQMRLEELRKQAKDKSDTEQGIAAERFVLWVWVKTYSEAMDAIANKQYRQALTNLEIAAQCAPDNPQVLYALARAYALNRDRANALAALRKSIQAGFADLEAIERNPELDSLRNLPKYAETIEPLKRTMQPAGVSNP